MAKILVMTYLSEQICNSFSNAWRLALVEIVQPTLFHIVLVILSNTTTYLKLINKPAFLSSPTWEPSGTSSAQGLQLRLYCCAYITALHYKPVHCTVQYIAVLHRAHFTLNTPQGNIWLYCRMHIVL